MSLDYEIIINDVVEEEKPHICEQCQICFSNRDALEIHKQSKEHKIICVSQQEPVDSKPVILSDLECPYCHKTFMKIFNLQRHKKIHENKREHRCKLCPKAFNDKSDLNRHERIHLGQTPFECELCGNQFTKKSDLTRHRKAHSDVWELKCKYCSKRFYRKDALIAHKKVHQLENDDELEDYKFTCSCGLGFNDHNRFEDHVNKMEHKKLFTCEECKNCYTTNDLLKKHERYHRERMFVCGDCDKAFAHSCDLVKHRRIHTGERPYLCSMCGKTFIRSTHLTSHIKNIHEKKIKGLKIEKEEEENGSPFGLEDENVMVEIEKCNLRIKIEGDIEVVENTDHDNNYLIDNENAVKIKVEKEEDEDYEVDVC